MDGHFLVVWQPLLEKQMTPFATFRAVISSVLADRAVQVGGTTSTVSLWGGVNAWHQWIGLYAAVIGALSARATLFYMVVKIQRMLRDKELSE
jgi:hypothetical protein